MSIVDTFITSLIPVTSTNRVSLQKSAVWWFAWTGWPGIESNSWPELLFQSATANALSIPLWLLLCEGSRGSGEASGLQCLKLERYAWWRRGKGVEQQLGSFASFSAEYYVNQWRPPLVRNIRTLAYPSSGTRRTGSFVLIGNILEGGVNSKRYWLKKNVITWKQIESTSKSFKKN